MRTANDEVCNRFFVDVVDVRVATPHGEQAIERLHVGQQVLAEDPHSGKVEAETVQAVIVDPVSPLLAVDLSDGSAIAVTADHPFWVDAGVLFAGPGWLPAGQLRIGDTLRTARGPDVTVVGVRRNVGHAVVYTLTVAHDHTFFVGSARVLVHNADCEEEFLASLDNLSRKEIAAGLSKAQVEKLGEFFGNSVEGAAYRLQNFEVPSGLTRESLLRYKVIAQKAIVEGRDTLGVQKMRLELVERALQVVQ